MADYRESSPGGSRLARTAGRMPEPSERDAEGKAVQPQDRPPARPHMTVTRKHEPNPQGTPNKKDET